MPLNADLIELNQDIAYLSLCSTAYLVCRDISSNISASVREYQKKYCAQGVKIEQAIKAFQNGSKSAIRLMRLLERESRVAEKKIVEYKERIKECEKMKQDCEGFVYSFPILKTVESYFRYFRETPEELIEKYEIVIDQLILHQHNIRDYITYINESLPEFSSVCYELTDNRTAVLSSFNHSSFFIGCHRDSNISLKSKEQGDKKENNLQKSVLNNSMKKSVQVIQTEKGIAIVNSDKKSNNLPPKIVQEQSKQELDQMMFLDYLIKGGKLSVVIIFIFVICAAFYKIRSNKNQRIINHIKTTAPPSISLSQDTVIFRTNEMKPLRSISSVKEFEDDVPPSAIRR